MSKDTNQPSVKDALNVRLKGFIDNIENTIKVQNRGNLQEVFSAFLNNDYFISDYKPFSQNLTHIKTMLRSDPITVMGFIKDRYFTVEEIREYQKEGWEQISRLAKPASKDEGKTPDSNVVTSTPSSTKGTSQKVLGQFTESLVQQPPGINGQSK